jgi:c-di-GMP-related signal transduction protein
MEAGKKIFDESSLKQAEDVIKSARFPGQPQILIDIRQEINKPEPVFKNIAALLIQDLALTAKILKTEYIRLNICRCSRKIPGTWMKLISNFKPARTRKRHRNKHSVISRRRLNAC